MTRRANINTPTPLETTVTFLRHEFFGLKHNTPGPSGRLGGYPRHENWVIENTDRATLRLVLDPERLQRTITYIKPGERGYGPGGPNARLRRAFIPALRRVGIDVLPEWRAP